MANLLANSGLKTGLLVAVFGLLLGVLTLASLGPVWLFELALLPVLGGCVLVVLVLFPGEGEGEEPGQ
jgi:peptidoglycan/LPS O-acetylase OafA/YrhL